MPFMSITNPKFFLVTALLIAPSTQAQVYPTTKIEGDIGWATYRTPAIARTSDKAQTFLPYVYADYGNYYARVDTFGYKLMPIATGHLELTARLSFENYAPKNTAIKSRSRPVPLGIGTFQETPYGALFGYAYKDAVSGGTFLDGTYAAELTVSQLKIYPQIGLERRSKKYVQHLYGVNDQEALSSGMMAYTPTNSWIPSVAVAFEYPLGGDLKLTYQVKKKWLDKSIYASPLVDVKSQTSSMLGMSMAFN